MEIDFKELWKIVTEQFHQNRYTVHGPDHWRRVERNGLILCKRTGANQKVVRLFALFHDSKRVNENKDDEHGARGAMFAGFCRTRYFTLSDSEFEALHYACTWHTDQIHHESATIGTCWDADRLDLLRVGIRPDRCYLNTEYAKKLSAEEDLETVLEELGRNCA